MAQAIVKIQAGLELGLPPVYSMQNINMIRNRLTGSANLLAMLVKKSGRYNYRVAEHNETKCSIKFFESENGKWIEVGESTFTMDDAKRANLIKPDSGWAKYPRAMLFSRAISQGARLYCPDAIGGVYTDEEIRTIPPRPDDIKAILNKDTGEVIEQETQPEPPLKAVTSTKSVSTEPLDTTMPDGIKTLTDMQKAVHKMTKMQPADQLKELGYNNWTDITETPADCYQRLIAAANERKERTGE